MNDIVFSICFASLDCCNLFPDRNQGIAVAVDLSE
jgi:hypothetical protein